jgi:hypothetical protein
MIPISTNMPRLTALGTARRRKRPPGRARSAAMSQWVAVCKHRPMAVWGGRTGLRVFEFQQRQRQTINMKIFSVIFAIAASLMWQAGAQTYDTNSDCVQTFAGSAFYGFLDGQGQATMFSGPMAIVSDSQTNLYVWDYGLYTGLNMRIRKITPDATVTTFAGGGNQTPGVGIVGTNADLGNLLNGVVSMAVDRNNTMWLFNESSLYTITSNGIVSTTNLAIGTCSGMCMDSNGKIYLSLGNQIYQYNTNGSASVFVGSGNLGAIDGNGLFTSFSSPKSMACDSANNIYVWDSGNYLIRRIDQSRNVVTIAGHNGGPNEPIADGVGTNASFAGTGILAMCADNSGNLYFACGSCIRKMDAQTNVVTLAGSFTQTGYTNGAGNLARFNGADGIYISGGTIYVSDYSNYRVRQISFNPQPQVVTGPNIGIGTFAGITIAGAIGRTYQIQASSDMNTWSTVSTVLLNSSPYLWIDQNPVNGKKFYRAILLP